MIALQQNSLNTGATMNRKQAIDKNNSLNLKLSSGTGDSVAIVAAGQVFIERHQYDMNIDTRTHIYGS